MTRISKIQLIKLQKKLGTDNAIGKKLGITRQAVHKMRQKYGIESLLTNNPERDKEIRRLKKAGTPAATLCRKYNLTISQVYRIVREQNRNHRTLTNMNNSQSGLIIYPVSLEQLHSARSIALSASNCSLATA